MINLSDPIYIVKKNMYNIYNSKLCNKDKYDLITKEYNNLDQKSQKILIDNLEQNLPSPNDQSALFSIISIAMAMFSLIVTLSYHLFDVYHLSYILNIVMVVIIADVLYIVLAAFSSIHQNHITSKIKYILDVLQNS